VLQRVAACCGVLRRDRVHVFTPPRTCDCSVLQSLQCVAACCGVFQCGSAHVLRLLTHVTWRSEAPVLCCSILQGAAACCSASQCFVACCSVLQCAVLCCSLWPCSTVFRSVVKCAAVCCRVFEYDACIVAIRCACRREHAHKILRHGPLRHGHTAPRQHYLNLCPLTWGV